MGDKFAASAHLEPWVLAPCSFSKIYIWSGWKMGICLISFYFPGRTCSQFLMQRAEDFKHSFPLKTTVKATCKRWATSCPGQQFWVPLSWPGFGLWFQLAIV